MTDQGFSLPETTKKLRQACFVQGTLVHTVEGLRPIEALKVGDCLLSIPETGKEGGLLLHTRSLWWIRPP